MKIYDISMMLNAKTAEWEGDTPFTYELTWTKEQSGSVNVGKITTSTHIGTHIDAPFHFDNKGKKVHELPLEKYVTKALVVDVSGKEEISAVHLPSRIEEGVGAILFKTEAWSDRTIFPQVIPLFNLSVVDWMVSNKINLFGVDLPSVDPVTSKELPFHHYLNLYDRVILEGVVLTDVSEGYYELIALPLKIEGAEGSPVRAILIER